MAVDSSHNGSQKNGSTDRLVESETDRKVAEAMELYLAEWEAGRVPDRRQFLCQYTEIANELEDHLEGLEFLCQVGPQIADSTVAVDSGSSTADTPIRPLATLGDFRIVREIGRGGMGVVYEAQQLSLGRTVALKILPFAATLDKRQLKRFQTEARAAASLEHPNVIPVYCVGNQRGVTYYAMQLIRGMTIAEVIRQLRLERLAEGDARRTDRLGRLTVQFSKVWAGGSHGQETGEKRQDGRPIDAVSDAFTNLTMGCSSTEIPGTNNRLGPTRPTTITAGSSSGRHAHTRMVARLGIQAAEGLEHAHEQGIVHRDVKPANLMLDENGKLVVMDFGLARIEADPGMTMTGTVLGTLRYMAPEQALSDQGVVDHRADIYSLGITLYELLTLQPALIGEDRRTLLRNIASDQPRPPRKLDPSIPATLETIILKAMAKEAGSRYRSARELADDLKRFLEHKPILAKRPSWLERATKWSIRHQPIVWSSLVILLLATIGLATSTAIVARQKLATTDALRTAEENRFRSETDRKLAEEAVDFSQKLLYLRDLSLAAHAYQGGDAVRASALLQGNPAYSARPELRGFEWHYLHRQVMQDHKVVLTQKEEICAVCYAPDGKEFATAGADGLVHLWNTQTLARRISLPGHASFVRQLSYHPGGSVLASCSDDGSVRLWDVESGRQRMMLEQAHDGAEIYDVEFSHDATLLATVGGDNRARLWRVADGVPESVLKPDSLLEGHTRPVRAVAFSPDDTLLATASNDRTVCIWEVKTGHLLRTLKGHMGMVLTVAFSPDGQYVASGGNDRTIRYWRPRTGHCELVLRGHHDGIQSLAFLPCGKRIVAGDRGGNIRVWKTTRRILDQFQLEADNEHFSATALSPNGREWAALSSKGRLMVREIAFERTRTLAENFPATQWFRGLDFSPDGQRLICGVRVFARDHDGPQGWREETAYADGIIPDAAALAPDGRLLATANGGSIHIWDTQTNTEVESFNIPRSRIKSLCFSADAAFLATASTGGHVEIWDLSSGQRQADLPGNSGNVQDVTFSKSGKYLASSSTNGVVRVWDRSLRKSVGLFSARGVHRIEFSPDERFLVGAHQSGTVREWSLVGKGDRGTLFQDDRQDSFEAGFWNVQFSSSGNELLCGSGGRSVFVLDMTRLTATNDPAENLQGHQDRVWSIAVPPMGQPIVSASRDGTVRSWSPYLASWNWLVGHRDEPNRVSDMVFTTDGRALLESHLNQNQTFLRSLSDGAIQRHLPSPFPMNTARLIKVVAIGLDQQIVATGHRNGVVVLWDLERQAKIRHLSAFPEADNEVDALAISPDGTTLATATRWGNRLSLWDVATGKRLEEFEANDCDSLAFSPDGGLLAYCDGRDVVLRDLRTRAAGNRLAGHLLTVHAVAFAPDGQTVASVGEDRKIRLWDTETGKGLWQRSAHAAPVRSVAYSPDGKTIASGAEDGSIKLWHAETGEEFFELDQASTSVVKLAFSPNQHVLLGLLYSGDIVLFEAD